MVTPIEQYGKIWAKRDDKFTFAGQNGGKVRTCLYLARRAHARGARGLVTAGSRHSPQVNIVAHIAKQLGMACRVHIPQGELGPELISAKQCGAVVVQHPAGYNNVIIDRARTDATKRGWGHIPFGMQCREAVVQTAEQCKQTKIPNGVKRVVVPVGSGMSLIGVYTGLRTVGSPLPVLGVCVGANPRTRLNQYLNSPWWRHIELVRSGYQYEQQCTATLDGLQLDPIYEAKCVQFLKPGDLFWIVGRREHV